MDNLDNHCLKSGFKSEKYTTQHVVHTLEMECCFERDVRRSTARDVFIGWTGRPITKMTNSSNN